MFSLANSASFSIKVLFQRCIKHPPTEIDVPLAFADLDGIDEDCEHVDQRKERSPNMFGYKIGDYMNCNYYRKFLCPEVREVTYLKSCSRQSAFRSHFRVPLITIDHLTETFITNGWVEATQRCHSHHMLITRTNLFIMCSLEHLGNRRPHVQFETETNMSYTEHRNFFNMFIQRMYSIRRDYISFPSTVQELCSTVNDYAGQYLPGACGSIDVVHVKWSRCPAGDYNKCKGRESFPSVAFECVTNNRRRILGIAPIQFGSRSDKHIVRLDPTVGRIRHGWYKDVKWQYRTMEGELKTAKGVYLICDGGYLRWKSLMCPYAGSPETGRRGYYNSNLESIRKDVECTFGILKKRWRILDYGLQYYDMKFCEMIFNVCCELHNMLLDVGEDYGFRNVRVRCGRGAPIGNDGLWLEGPETMTARFMGETCIAKIKADDKKEAKEWMTRRELLADHLEYCKSINK